MKANTRYVVTMILGILLPISARSQGPGMNLAAMRAFWKPVVGAGAAYSLEQKDLGKIEMEIAVVGTETVAGKTGYWTEQTMKDPRREIEDSLCRRPEDVANQENDYAGTGWQGR